LNHIVLDGPPEQLPLRLADLHASLAAGDRVGLAWERPEPPVPVDVLVTGAGFGVVSRRGSVRTAVRLRTLPDTLGPGMRLLLVGLNPSLHAADHGYGFAGPGNRFWPAAAEAGLFTVLRDSRHALVVDHIGMTDLVKRASPSAAGLAVAEFASGLSRVEALCAWLRPGAVCFVGLTGYRAARDRHASPGPQPEPLAGMPVYVMGNPSGRNAHASGADLAVHLRAALAIGDEASRPGTRA
jgi:double-stranded uracil-DNA glycosylase